MPELVQYQTKLMQSGILLFWYRTEIMNARILMLARDSQSNREGHSGKSNALGWATLESPIPQGVGGTAESPIPQWGGAGHSRESDPEDQT
jgi:hypothetical protein